MSLSLFTSLAAHFPAKPAHILFPRSMCHFLFLSFMQPMPILMPQAIPAVDASGLTWRVLTAAILAFLFSLSLVVTDVASHFCLFFLVSRPHSVSCLFALLLWWLLCRLLWPLLFRLQCQLLQLQWHSSFLLLHSSSSLLGLLSLLPYSCWYSVYKNDSFFTTGLSSFVIESAGWLYWAGGVLREVGCRLLLLLGWLGPTRAGFSQGFEV